MPRGKKLLRTTRSKASRVYDARLIATMNVYVVESILTFNTPDFKRYGAITVLHPSSVAT